MSESEINMNLERFKIALETRNFEIELFWKRCNYFLVLNTALAVGIFLLFRDGNTPPLPLLLLIFFVGIFVCIAWVMVVCGSKYWQSHWEQVVIREQEHIGLCESKDRDYFGLDSHRKRVAANLKIQLGADTEIKELSHVKFIRRIVMLSLPFVKEKEKDEYKKLLLQKPSVTDWMQKTAVFFLLTWMVMLTVGSVRALWKCGFFEWLLMWLRAGIQTLCKLCG